MSTITVNQINVDLYLKKLRAANFTEDQAQIIVELIEQQTQVIQALKNKVQHLENQETLATDRELNAAELRLQDEIQSVRMDMLQIESRLIKWLR